MEIKTFGLGTIRREGAPLDPADQLERDVRMAAKPTWNGGFVAARRIADEILEDYLGASRNDGLAERIAEALVNAFDNGVYAEHCTRDDPEIRRQILTVLLREYGIGIASLEEMEALTTAVARGEFKPSPDEPKLWFSSIEGMIELLKKTTQSKPEEEVR